VNFLTRLLDDDNKLSPQAFMGCLLSIGSFFIWATISGFLAVTGKSFAYYDAMTTGAFGMISAGASLLGYHLNQVAKGSDQK
jgi:hypothetical protein